MAWIRNSSEGAKEGDRFVTAVAATGKSRRPVWRAAVQVMSADEPSAPVIRLRNVVKTYRTGEVEVHAVRGVSLECAAGRFRGHHGRERLGQIDADEYPRLPRSTHHRRLPARWRERRPH